MPFASFRSLTRSRHLAWLLALALWLPAAQWVSATHALLHLHASVTGQADPPEHLPDSCDTCVVAAALGAAAPALDAPSFAAPRLAALPPVCTDAASPALAPARPYQSRAPPLPHA